MAYNKMEDQPEGMDSAAESAPSQSPPREDTYDLPPDFDGINDLAVGDTLTLRVVRKYPEGGAEVECLHPEGEKPKGMIEDLRETMSGPPPEEESEY